MTLGLALVTCVGYAVISYRARLSTLTASPWLESRLAPSQLRLDSRIALSFLPIPCRASAKALCGSQGALSPFASRSHHTGGYGLARSQEACSRREVRESPVRRVRNACLIIQSSVKRKHLVKKNTVYGIFEQTSPVFIERKVKAMELIQAKLRWLFLAHDICLSRDSAARSSSI